MFKTVFYTVHSRKLPAEFDNYRITHLSDLHGAVYGQNHRKLIQKIRQTNPNLVVMTGFMPPDLPLLSSLLCFGKS